ncbi:hypothetical protein ACWTV9_19510 [Clostridioides difficile]
MKIGKYLIMHQEQAEKRIEDLKKEVRKRDDRIKFLEFLENELIENLEEQLKEYKSELDIYNLFIDCLFDKDMRKAVAIYNRTKSMRIKRKHIDSLNRKVDISKNKFPCRNKGGA